MNRFMLQYLIYGFKYDGKHNICYTARLSSSSSLATPSLGTDWQVHGFPEKWRQFRLFSSQLANSTLQHLNLEDNDGNIFVMKYQMCVFITF